MSAVSWVQQLKTLTYNEFISTTSSVDIIMSEKYKNAQADKINAFPCKMRVIDKKYFKGKYLIKLDL